MRDMLGADEWEAADEGLDALSSDELDELFDPQIRRIFRAVAIDRFRHGTMPVRAELLFGPDFGPWGSDWDFLGELYNEIHHQDTCDEHSAEGVRLLAALAVDDRVPARERMSLITVLFDIATEVDRHTAECWPAGHPQADTEAAFRARAAVEVRLTGLLARWDMECLGVRLALAALAAVFPVSPAVVNLLPKVEALAQERRRDAAIVGYLRFVLLLARGTEDQVLAQVESLTASYWHATYHEVPVPARAVHLLDQMLSRMKATLLAWRC